MSNQTTTTLTPRPSLGEQVDLYRFFAFILATPTPERFEWLQRPTLEDALELLWMELDCDGEFPRLGSFVDYQDYESTYLALFDVGLPQPPVPLLESAHYKALPAQQTALESTYFYEVLDLQADTSQYAPDHLVTQLEFLAAVRFTRENSTHEANGNSLAHLERDFLERHLFTWLPACEKKLTQQGPPVFPLLFTLLLVFLRHRHAALKR